MLSIKVRYFAMLKEQKGCAEEVIQCAEGTTPETLYTTLFPTQATAQLRVGFAINLVQVDGSTILQDGDELAFLPPLGGG